MPNHTQEISASVNSMAKIILQFATSNIACPIAGERIGTIINTAIMNDMIRAIREAGRVPVQRATFYEPLREWAGEEALAKA